MVVSLVKLIILFSILTVILSSCKKSNYADLIIYNGIIYTVDSLNNIVESVAVKDDKIIETGKYIDIKKRGKYFELGPGLCRMYKTFYSQGWNCQGLEPRSFIKAPGIKRKINQINGKVDIIVAFDVLEHVADPLKYLKLLNTKLKKGGKIFLTFPNAESFKSKILKDKWSMIAPLGHVNFFSKKSVKIMFMKSGFETLILKDFSLVDPRRLVRNLLKLPFKCLKDIIFLKFNSLFHRFREFFMNCLDLINGDQLKVVGKKIQK